MKFLLKARYSERNSLLEAFIQIGVRYYSKTIYLEKRHYQKFYLEGIFYQKPPFKQRIFTRILYIHIGQAIITINLYLQRKKGKRYQKLSCGKELLTKTSYSERKSSPEAFIKQLLARIPYLERSQKPLFRKESLPRAFIQKGNPYQKFLLRKEIPTRSLCLGSKSLPGASV